MKKIFTFVFCAFCALSVWGTEVAIGSGTATDANVPSNFKKSYSLVEIIYTKTELLAAGAQAGSITGINFKYAKTNEHTRRWDIYVGEASHDKTGTSIDALKTTDLVFSGEITTPTAMGWYNANITFSKPYYWDGNSNIEILIYDHTESTILFERLHYVYTTTNNQVAYTSGDNPYDPTQSGISCSYGNKVPHIKFIFGGGDDPTPVTTPTITTSTDALNFGTCYPEYEDAIKTFTVKASDLTNKITITAPTGVVVSPTEIAKEEAALAGDGVTVTAQITKDFTFPVQAPSITIASEDATSKTVKVNATEGTFTTLSMMSFLNTEGYFFLNFDATINSINTSDKSMEIRNVSPKNANYALIDGQETFAVGGKFSGLKGKYENEVFKIFSYTSYTAPAPTSVVEVDENNDKSESWTGIDDGDNVTMLTIKRTIVPNQWNSIVLPTHLTSTEVENIFGTNTDLEEFTSAVVTSSNIELNFTQLGQGDGIEAGVPYLIKPTQAIANPLNLQNRSFTKTVTPVDHDGIRFEGVLVPTEIDGGDGSDYIIVGANNTLFHPTGTGTIKGMRAYFHIIGTEAKAALKTAKINMNTGSTTEMVLIKDNQIKPYKTMVNDQIVIVNEGKQINILGQIIK